MSDPLKDPYQAQHRGDRGAYDRYLSGMNTSMRQKVALTAAHLLGQGRIADMGMGSGGGSVALAALYPALQVIGVDIEPRLVERARGEHQHPNLSFIQGDIAQPCFPPATLDGIFDSSVLHHVTSFNGYDHEAAARALAVQVDQLRPDGVLIVRDFLAVDAAPVLLDLPTSDGDESDDPRRCSTAALFERFAREFRSLHAAPGFPYSRVSEVANPPLRAGFRRYALAHRHAVEFALRKDYRADWESEVQEEYGYFTKPQFEAHFARLALRVLASTPIRNPWIIRHRLRDRLALWTAAGQAMELPATNYIIVGEKVAAGQGVTIQEARPAASTGFLGLEHYEHRATGAVMDLVWRPHLTVDVLPWFELEDDLFVIARKSYPRPILGAAPDAGAALDGASPAVYITEPLTVLQADAPLGRTVEEALRERAGISDILGFAPGASYAPSPGGIQEEVRSFLVAVAPLFVRRDIENWSGFASSGQIRAMEAQQVLRAAQVGGLPNARIELNVYELLLRLGRAPGAWIGEELELKDSGPPSHPASLLELARRPARRAFTRVGQERSRGFLELRAALFEERDAQGRVVAERVLEYVVPRHLSRNTIATALLRRHGAEVYLGLADEDLPAAQCFTGNSELLVAPAWRLPRSIAAMSPALAWVRSRLTEEYGLELGATFELGGRYTPSPGATPEVVHPLAVEVLSERPARRPLLWVHLRELIEQRAQLQDGHLRIVALRAAHALGLLGSAAGRTSG